jgi:hypothetical protein
MLETRLFGVANFHFSLIFRHTAELVRVMKAKQVTKQ